MKKLALLLLLGAVAFAGVANAAPVARSATLSLTLTIQGLPGIVVGGGVGTVTVDTVANTLAVGAGQIQQTAPITIPVTASTAIASVKGTGVDNFAATFSIGGGSVTSPATELPCPSASPPAPGIGCVGGAGLGGQMALSGTIFAVIVPMLVTVPVPLVNAQMGVGGFNRIPNTPAGFLFDAAPFTTGVAKVGYTASSKTTWMGAFMSNPLTVTYTMSWVSVGSSTGANDGLGAGATGSITLVSPTYLSALGNLLPVWTVLNIHFIPEPGTLLLLGAGIGGLVLVGRRRR